jgi:hypothetical protein
MKMRHLPAAFIHSPGFVLRHGAEMLAHTFTGTSVRSILGLENERAVFERYRQERRRAREYVPRDAVQPPPPSHHAAWRLGSTTEP